MNTINIDSLSEQVGTYHIDTFITCSSFEDRCFIIPNKIANSQSISQSFIFFNGNEYQSIADNAIKLKQIFTNETDTIELNSDDPIYNYFEIYEVVKKLINSNQPNLLIDITTFTHESLLVLLKLLYINKDSLGNVYMAYITAKEYSTNQSEDKDKWLSKGVKEIRTIIGYPGITDPTKLNHLIILFGFEIERTKKLIEEYEYDEITLGFGDTPIQSNHLKINSERHKRLMLEYPNANKMIFSLIDPFKTKEEIENYISMNGYSDQNIVIAALNNKISTIGAGLAALENNRIQLAYAKPNVYNAEGYSAAGEDVFLYQIFLDK